MDNIQPNKSSPGINGSLTDQYETITSYTDEENDKDYLRFQDLRKRYTDHEMYLTLSLKDACVALGMLAQAIERVSTTQSKQADQ